MKVINFDIKVGDFVIKVVNFDIKVVNFDIRIDGYIIKDEDYIMIISNCVMRGVTFRISCGVWYYRKIIRDILIKVFAMSAFGITIA